MLLETESTLEFIHSNTGSSLGHLLLDARRQLSGRVDSHTGDGLGIHGTAVVRQKDPCMANEGQSQNQQRMQGSGIGDKRTQASRLQLIKTESTRLLQTQLKYLLITNQ